jgi:hypothetical protein
MKVLSVIHCDKIACVPYKYSKVRPQNIENCRRRDAMKEALNIYLAGGELHEHLWDTVGISEHSARHQLRRGKEPSQ